jgi:hypothetical protein
MVNLDFGSLGSAIRAFWENWTLDQMYPKVGRCTFLSFSIDVR